MTVTESAYENSIVSNRRVGFIGKLGGMNRKELKQLVRNYGGTVAEVVDSNVDLVVLGENMLAVDELPIEDSNFAEMAASGKLEVMTETEFWQGLGMVETEEDARRMYTPAMLAELLEVPISTIRRWHRRGLITPSRKVHKLSYFDFQEVASAKKIAELISSGASAAAIESKLSKLVGLFPDLQRPLSQLSVIVEGRELLLRNGGGLIEPGGQKRFDFSSEEAEQQEGSDVITFEQAVIERDVDQLQTRDDFIELAVEYEDEDDIESACEVYRSMLLAFGPSPDICFRLAENLFHIGDLAAARERYYVAIELDEHFVEARASLGCLLVELGKHELAISAFQGALEHHPDYPDVTYHLARELDEVGRPEEAESYWQKFLDLAPRSPWADEARGRLGII